MAFTRRVFLSLLGLVPLLTIRSVGAAAAPLAPPVKTSRGDDIVVVGGWVLRREDLAQLPPQ